MKNFNKLTPKQAEALAILSEECGEVIQAIGKILRHGYEDYSPFDETKTSNRINLEREIGDVIFATKLLDNDKQISLLDCNLEAKSKEDRVKPYLHHQKDEE